MDFPALSLDDPKTQGILALAMGLLKAGGPSQYPVPLGAALGQGGAAGLGQYISSKQEQQKYNLTQEQIKQLKLNNDLLGGKANFFAGINAAPGPDSTGGTSPIVNPSANAPYGPPISGGQPGGLPLVPGLTPELSRAAALGWISPDYVNAVASANKPMSTRYGIFAPDPTNPGTFKPVGGALPQGALPYQVGPNGATDVQPYPSQIKATTDLTAAAEAGKAPYQFEPYKTASGATVGVPKDVAVKGPDAIKSYITGLTGPSTPTVAPKPSAKPMQPNATADPWTTMPKLQIPSGIGQSTYQAGRQQGAAKIADEVATKNSDAASIANERLVYNTQALGLLDQATTGSGALSIANVKNFLHSRMGIPTETMDKVVAGDANATTALNKNLINAATQKAKQAYGSRITQSEVMLQIKQASPNVDQMTATIRYLLNTDNAMSQYQIRKASDVGKYLQNGGDPYQFEGWYSKTFPMSQAVGQSHAVNRPPLSSFQK